MVKYAKLMNGIKSVVVMVLGIGIPVGYQTYKENKENKERKDK